MFCGHLQEERTTVIDIGREDVNLINCLRWWQGITNSLGDGAFTQKTATNVNLCDGSSVHLAYNNHKEQLNVEM